jgi:hypothetical protein
MRSVSRGSRRGASRLTAAILMGMLALTPRSARAGQVQVMPMVLPQESLPYLQQLNGGTGFSVVCLSQAPIASAGATVPTAVVDLSPPAGAVGPDGSFPLFMFPQDVPVVQQLNGGMPIIPVALYPMPSSGAGKPTQVAQVSVAEPVPMQSKVGSPGCLLVCPVPSLPLLGQLNPELSFDVLCTSQAGAGKAGRAAQTALLDIQPAQGTLKPSQPLPILLPVDTLPALGQLNAGTTMDVIDVTEMPAGGVLLPVALVDVKQNPQALTPPASNAGKGNKGGQGDDQAGKGNDDGKGNGKGSGKGNGKGNGKGKGNGDD